METDQDPPKCQEENESGIHDCIPVKYNTRDGINFSLSISNKKGSDIIPIKIYAGYILDILAFI
ncbi:hypothetical protein SOASR015_36140 [Pectobacterium carotovorum subsp. carotovorum]|nr:hypothetical protein SOASR015_36140 [Pectobacterium carotovorum subsp. carotovorum]